MKQRRIDRRIRICATRGTRAPTESTALIILAVAAMFWCLYLTFVRSYSSIFGVYALIFAVYSVILYLTARDSNQQYRAGIARLPEYEYLKTASTDVLEQELHDFEQQKRDFEYRIRRQQLEKERLTANLNLTTANLAQHLAEQRYQLEALRDIPEHQGQRQTLSELIESDLREIEDAKRDTAKLLAICTSAIEKAEREKSKAERDLEYETDLRKWLLKHR